MWKYLTKEQSNDFLLSLNLLDRKNSKDVLKTLYAISNNIENNYKIYKVKKKNGKLRTIYEPNNTLKHIQRQILKNILETRTISSYAKAYHKGISLKDNALPHINKKIILKLDIKDFFNNISFIDIYNSCFPIEYFPKEIGMLLTYLCTYKESLPQGAPTSAAISNLVMKEFDEELGSWCKNKNITYTRYSDDMTFSGDFNPSDIISYVNKLLSKLGLELNKEKIHVIKCNKQQKVTGVVVNNKANTSNSYRKKIRQELYFINKYGLSSHLIKIKSTLRKEEYLNNLYGRILFVLQIDPYNKEFINYKKEITKLRKL